MKMDQGCLSITFPLEYDISLTMISLKLVAEGFFVAKSFELQAACASFTDTSCPHNGESPCDCQVVTLFARDQNSHFVPLVVHGHADQTEIYIDTSSHQTDLDLGNRIQEVLQNERSALLRLKR